MTAIEAGNHYGENQPAGKSNLGFLSLPGEIRNAIYELVAQHAINDKQTRRGNEVTLYYHGQHSSSDSSRWQNARRQGLGLVQASRQLREEYGPIYSRNTKMYISLHRLVQHVQWLSEDDQLVVPAGNLVIGLRNWSDDLTCDQVRLRDIAVNIAPLLRIYKRSPNAQLTFDDSRFYLDQVFSVRENDTWWRSLEEAIDKVEISPVYLSADASMSIWVKSAFSQRWMQDQPVGRHPQRDAWLASVGLGRICAWPQPRFAL